MTFYLQLCRGVEMIVQVVRYNTKREVVKVDKHKVKHIRFQAAGLVELKGYGDDMDITYLMIKPGDPLDIFIQDNNAESKQ
jgi:hypothetical protein